MDETTFLGAGALLVIVVLAYSAVELVHAIRGDVSPDTCMQLCHRNVRSMKGGDCECFTVADGGVP